MLDDRQCRFLICFVIDQMKSKSEEVNVNVSLTPELEAFVREQVESGMYTSASEVMRQALRLLVLQERQEHAKLEALRLALREGLESGEARPFNVDDFLQSVRKKDA